MALDKIYSPVKHEARIYEKWEESGTFAPQKKAEADQSFSVVLPPPNANADLHLGYALDVQLKDVLARWHRLRGKSVLLLPGADHAGFETWAVYEKHLQQQGLSRFDLPKDKLYEKVYDFVISNMDNMKGQIKSLGISCDWQRFTFSLDEKIIQTTYETFDKMWREDLIYRGKRLINYCTYHGTGFSDIEISYKNVKGKLWFIRYPAADDGEDIVVATTRPETMLGDMAVAVHPDDKRRTNRAKFFQLPLSQRKIPLIADERIDPEFGTGAVKITPAHDFLDFEIAATHKLKQLEIIDKEGKITALAPEEFQGLPVLKARQAVLEKLRQEGWLVKEEAYEHQVGHCYKCGSILEPLLANQWFVRMQPLAKAAIRELKKEAMKFYPASKKKELITYLGQLQDWNISRQIVWGIPIPVFQNQKSGKWVFSTKTSLSEIELDGQKYVRDPDVFDTWFSSGQWPFATLDWQNQPQFYPQHLMETGADILRPWVARMILLGLYITKQVPFKTVYLHGMIIDEKGAKMSKSKGNVISPMSVISEYGSDALRIALCSQTTPGQPQRLIPSQLLDSRNFCNKLWNIGRFVETQKNETAEARCQTMADSWIWQCFEKAKSESDNHLKRYKLSLAWQTIYDFVWHDLADWYLESCKWRANPAFLKFLFEHTLRLVHPFAPFVSEALYEKLYAAKGVSLLIVSPWPKNLKPSGFNLSEAENFTIIKEQVSKMRRLLPLALRQQGELNFQNKEIFTQNLDDLYQRLTQIKNLRQSEKPPKSHLIIENSKTNGIWLALDKSLIEKQQKHMADELKDLRQRHKNLQKRLSSENYLKKAPQHLIEDSRAQSRQLEQKIDDLEEQIISFNSER